MSVRFVRILGLALLGPILPVRAQEPAARPADAARSMIAMEARSFQRDLAARDWNALQTHFWPAKITARWDPPVGTDVWANAARDPRAPGGPATVPADLRCGAEGSTIAIVGRWARVLLPSCASRPSELWMLEVSGRWKIVRLTLEGDPALARSDASQ